MDLNNDIYAGLMLINHPTITEEDLASVYDQCDKIFKNVATKTINNSDLGEEKSKLSKILIFSITTLVLEAAKNGLNHASLIRLLQDQPINHQSGLNCSTVNFVSFENFLKKSIPIVQNNLNNLQLEPELRFQDLEWSQMLEVNGKQKTYMIEIYAGQQQPPPSAAAAQSIGGDQPKCFPILFGEKELQDFYATIRDCVRNLENCLKKETD